ncbi:hypothetical protein AGLY_009130 [Aphis glycines]|uniref:Uncharacterized protein n=1 Tax=Aphis glycines TaxID=307491 RepID=A0A6G0TIK5_APHGL|nr:hypothetical protein AGLY_009130 [Aphis glycines]
MVSIHPILSSIDYSSMIYVFHTNDETEKFVNLSFENCNISSNFVINIMLKKNLLQSEAIHENVNSHIENCTMLRYKLIELLAVVSNVARGVKLVIVVIMKLNLIHLDLESNVIPCVNCQSYMIHRLVGTQINGAKDGTFGYLTTVQWFNTFVAFIMVSISRIKLILRDHFRIDRSYQSLLQYYVLLVHRKDKAVSGINNVMTTLYLGNEEKSYTVEKRRCKNYYTVLKIKCLYGKKKTLQSPEMGESMIKNIMIIIKRYNCPGGGSVGSSSWITTVAAPDTELK